MKVIKDSKYKSVLNKIKQISDILDIDSPQEEEVHEAVVNFVNILEYIIKKKLFKKNKLLIYEFNSTNVDILKAIISEKVKNINTINVSNSFLRYKKFYPKSKLIKQEESIEILIENRNELIHSINLKNIQNKEDLIGILGSVFPILLLDSKEVLGVLTIAKVKKEKIYTEKDIQKIYEDNLLAKVNIKKDINPLFVNGFNNLIENKQMFFSFGSEICPRCSNFSLSKKIDAPLIFSLVERISMGNNSDLYVCSKCNLELTPSEYDTIQKLKKEGKLNGIFGTNLGLSYN